MIPFNLPFVSGKEKKYIDEVFLLQKYSGANSFSVRVERHLSEIFSLPNPLTTPSCTAALELAVLSLGLGIGDEVILPSFTFVSTANAFALRGCKLIFADIRRDTLNIDETLVEALITPATKAIAIVHYAGVCCNMDEILKIAAKHNLYIIEDAAQAICSTYKGKPAGTFGDLSGFSFHETKNLHCGEGGVLCIKNQTLIARCEVIREKGTDRASFFRGEVDKYTWRDYGSSYLLNELSSAFLLAQLESASQMLKMRLDSWNYYHSKLQSLQHSGLVCLPSVPAEVNHNGHIYHLVFNCSQNSRDFIAYMGRFGVHCVSHYVPLHSSPYALSLSSSVVPSLPVTEFVASAIVRLPLWPGIQVHQDKIIEIIYNFFEKSSFNSF